MDIQLTSSMIDGASYDEKRGYLRLYLRNGQLREFRDVPREVVEGLQHAPSAGNYYIQHIRGHFTSPN